MIQILELFGGVGSPRCALRNIGIPVKSIDYVEIDEKAVRSYNAMFADEMNYIKQDVRGFTLRPDIMIHGSPCQDISVAGKQLGADEGSDTRSSLMWETLNIIRQMGQWRPKYVIWENVRNVLSKRMVPNFNRYLSEMESLGYTSSYKTLNAMEFGLPQNRLRVFTISSLGSPRFNFENLEPRKMPDVWEFIEPDRKVACHYDITCKSMLRCIDPYNFDNAPLRTLSVIRDYAMTISTAQDRCPNAGIIKRKSGVYRTLTERECWRLQGFSDSDYNQALAQNPGRRNKRNTALYKQAGNAMPVTVMESIFTEIARNNDWC